MAAAFYDFDRALVRAPGASSVRGLRRFEQGEPSLEALWLEHSNYVRALEQAGVVVHSLAPLESHPDALFLEDPALVFTEGAVLLRAGAPSREGEAVALAPALRERFGTVLELRAGTVEGGDVLALSDRVLVGLSERTSREGAEQLSLLLERLGKRAELVPVPAGVLHLKSACSALDERTVLATEQLAECGVFTDRFVLTVPDDEPGGANVLRVNGVVLAGVEHPRTRALLEAHGYRVVPLPTAELAKLDAGLSCLSLRWRA